MKKTEEKKTGWVYCWVNLANGKRRVGHTIDLDRRIKEHIREAKNPKYHLQYAIEKYTLQNFVVESIEVPRNEMIKLETFWKKLYYTTNPDFGYDKLIDEEDRSGENHPMFGKHHTEESRKLMGKSGENHPMFGKKRPEHTKRMSSENHPMYGRRGENSPLFGKHHTQETRKLMSEKHKGKHHLEETKKLMSEKKSGQNNPNFGKHHTQETRKLMSIKRKQYLVNKKADEIIKAADRMADKLADKQADDMADKLADDMAREV